MIVSGVEPKLDGLHAIAEKLRPLFPGHPDIAIILGSGLGGFGEELQDIQRVPTSSLAGYPPSTVRGHGGLILSGRLYDKRLICFQGRVHLYEGYAVEEVVLPVQVAAQLGARILILTNAAGGIHPALKPGSFMIIGDQIDLQFRRKRRAVGGDPQKPLQIERERVFASTCPYSERLIEIAQSAAVSRSIPARTGVLGAFLGPSYETPAEVRMASILGVHAVCMSTVAEAVEGARLGMSVLGISCITNRAAGLEAGMLDHADVINVAAEIRGKFVTFLEEIIRRIR